MECITTSLFSSIHLHIFNILKAENIFFVCFFKPRVSCQKQKRKYKFFPLPHFRICMQHKCTDSPWQSSNNLQMNWSHTNQAANQNNTEMCSSEGRPQTAAAQRSLHTETTGEPLQLNRSLHCTDKQQFPESPSPPLSKFTWGLGASAHVSDRGQSESVFTNTCNTGRIVTFPKTPLSREKS